MNQNRWPSQSVPGQRVAAVLQTHRRPHRQAQRACCYRMRSNMLAALGDDLQGRRILDAGCGTGAMALELAQRGADVLAVDLSSQLIALAKERAAQERMNKEQKAKEHVNEEHKAKEHRTREVRTGNILWVAGDMLDASFGHFDHVVAMDSLIHYDADDMANAVQRLSDRTRLSLHLSFAPRTPMLALMHAVGRCLPRADRAPSIVPLAAEHIISKLASLDPSRPNMIALGERVSSGFYISQLLHVLQAQQLQAEQACDQAQALRLS
ncbi:MAG: methyltransferase domain-containing protein [Betaproteobacteria bacterium]|nr:methyltransferase domain-containing protein [Betaproteobacteria bacterium]